MATPKRLRSSIWYRSLGLFSSRDFITSRKRSRSAKGLIMFSRLSWDRATIENRTPPAFRSHLGR